MDESSETEIERFCHDEKQYKTFFTVLFTNFVE